MPCVCATNATGPVRPPTHRPGWEKPPRERGMHDRSRRLPEERLCVPAIPGGPSAVRRALEDARLRRLGGSSLSRFRLAFHSSAGGRRNSGTGRVSGGRRPAAWTSATRPGRASPNARPGGCPSLRRSGCAGMRSAHAEGRVRLSSRRLPWRPGRGSACGPLLASPGRAALPWAASPVLSSSVATGAHAQHWTRVGLTRSRGGPAGARRAAIRAARRRAGRGGRAGPARARARCAPRCRRS